MGANTPAAATLERKLAGLLAGVAASDAAAVRRQS